MFLRRYVRNKDGKKHIYFALVESVRTDSGPRQQIVAYLGELNAEQERRWQRTVVFHNRQGEAQQLRLFPDDDTAPLPGDPEVVRVRVDTVGWTNARCFGDVYLARWLWNMLDLDTIINRHMPQGKETVRPVDVVAIEVINRLCAPCSELALAEHWYGSTALEDLLGVPDQAVTKDRLYRTLDQLQAAQTAIENDLKNRLQGLFHLDYELLLYDLTSSYFEGLAEENDLAKRGYSRDRRSDCPQIVLALIVTREGFPLAHYTLVGNTKDVQTVGRVVEEVERRFGTSQRIWVMDRGMISKDTLAFLNRNGRRYLLATRRHDLKRFQKHLEQPGWEVLPDHPGVVVKMVKRRGVHYLLTRSLDRKKKERAIRRRQRRSLAAGLRRLQARVAKGRLKNRDKIAEAIGRLKGRYPQAVPFVTPTIGDKPVSLRVEWKVDKFKDALRRDGAYLLRSNRDGWAAQEFWETYMQLTVAERAFRVLKSELLLRPIWHHYSGRTQAHVFVCVLAYALWKTLDHLIKRAGLQTVIRKPNLPSYGNAVPKPRPMTPEVVLRELSRIMIGDIEMDATDGRKLIFRRVARPNSEQKRILEALRVEMPERLSPDRIL